MAECLKKKVSRYSWPSGAHLVPLFDGFHGFTGKRRSPTVWHPQSKAILNTYWTILHMQTGRGDLEWYEINS